MVPSSQSGFFLSLPPLWMEPTNEPVTQVNSEATLMPFGVASKSNPPCHHNLRNSSSDWATVLTPCWNHCSPKPHSSQAGCSNNSTRYTVATVRLFLKADSTFLGQTVQWLPLPLTINLSSDSLPWSLKTLHIGGSCPQPRLHHGIPWGAFIKCQCQGPTPDQLNDNLWGWSLDAGNVFSSSDGSDVQAGRMPRLALCSSVPLLFPSARLLSIPRRCPVLISPRCSSTYAPFHSPRSFPTKVLLSGARGFHLPSLPGPRAIVMLCLQQTSLPDLTCTFIIFPF